MSNVITLDNTTGAVINDNPDVTDAPVTAAYRTAATSQGERDGRVSAQWASRPDDEKFLSLSDLRDSVLNRAKQSRTSLVNPRDIEVSYTEEGDVTLSLTTAGEANLSSTNWAFNQVCSLMRVPSSYLQRLPAQLAAINLQHGLMTYPGEQMKAYTYHNGSDNLRAMTSPSYGRIFDHEIVEEVMKIAGNGTGDTNWKVPGVIDWSSHANGTTLYNPFVDITKENTTLYASDRDVYMFLVDDTHPIEVGKLSSGEPDLMFRGFIVWNSEVGAQTFGIATMMLRGVCQNRNLWGVGDTSEIRIRHSKNAPQRFAYEAAPMLAEYTNASAAAVQNKVNNAKAAIVASNHEEGLEFLTSKAKLTKTLSERVLEAVMKEEQHPATSVWDMVQGITATARSIQHQDMRIALEAKGSKLMDKIVA